LIGSGIVTIQKGDPKLWPIAAAVAGIGFALVLYGPRWYARRQQKRALQAAVVAARPPRRA
jgi:hypothetical protein